MNGYNAESFPLLSISLNDVLEEFSVTADVKEGTVILQQGAPIRALPIVKKGTLRVLGTDEEGKEVLLYYIKPGESCVMSYIGLLNGEKSRVKAVAEEDCELMIIPLEKFSQLNREVPALKDYILRLYHLRFEELLKTIQAIAFQKADLRILRILKEKSKISGTPDIHITHMQLAEQLGTAREVVSRLLKQLEATGKLKLSRNQITVL